jgi:hypothetical protein
MPARSTQARTGRAASSGIFRRFLFRFSEKNLRLVIRFVELSRTVEECGTLGNVIGKESSLMAELESQQTTAGFPSKPAPRGDASGIGALSAPLAQTPSDSDEDRPVGGISVIPIPRREIARLQGTLPFSGLPRHKPTIVFDTSRQSRDTDDE